MWKGLQLVKIVEAGWTFDWRPRELSGISGVWSTAIMLRLAISRCHYEIPWTAIYGLLKDAIWKRRFGMDILLCSEQSRGLRLGIFLGLMKIYEFVSHCLCFPCGWIVVFLDAWSTGRQNSWTSCFVQNVTWDTSHACCDSAACWRFLISYTCCFVFQLGIQMWAVDRNH